MELILVRHGLPERTEARVELARVVPDPDLSATGRVQADRVALAATAQNADAVYSSPMRRAVQTAQPLAVHVGVPTVVEHDLHEIDIGEDSYIPMEQLRPGDERAAMWRAVLADHTGRLTTEFRARIGTVVDALVARHPGERVVVACHAGVITAALTHLLRIERTFSFAVDYASITRVQVSRDGRISVLAVNDRFHLAP
jgi:2,3-bisphosphoglycerate-dependent phosphoglycerate mutase